MQIIDAHIIERFARRHADARRPLEEWKATMAEIDYDNPQEIKNRFASASFLSGDRVVFNIKGNDYRLLTSVNYFRNKITVLRIGTHQEYDKRNL